MTQSTAPGLRGAACSAWRCALVLTLSLPTAAAVSGPDPGEYFKITVIDEATGRGVPMVELRTTNAITVYTDSNGIVAWNEPGLMDRDVYFVIRSHGYVFPREGETIRVTRGGSIVLKMQRLNVAERLYRITGQGIYRDSVLTGTPVPIRRPVLDAEVTGQDSVFATLYRGRIFWLWDDTGRAAGPLGSFAGCAATSELPGAGGLDPGVGIDLDYLLGDSGFCKPITPFPVPGMKWKYWAATVTDEQGRERLVVNYRSMKSLDDPIEIGLAIFNDEARVFERVTTFGRDFQLTVPTHPFWASDRGTEFLYFPSPLPHLRARPKLEALMDSASYEGFSCLAAGSRYAGDATVLDRTTDGTLRCAWKKGTPPITFDQEKALIKAGKMAPDEGIYQLRDIQTGAAVKPHAGSVYWNDYRARWIMIVQEDRGVADNGEIWYAESDTPVGPWVYARKVVTHDRYTFYNPTQHPFFDREGGRLIYFEGTYSDTFSGSPVKTPRYDYNQIMYRLALDDARLRLPVPVYRLKNGRLALREDVAARDAWGDVEAIPFFALPPGRRDEDVVSIGGLFSALSAAGPPRRALLAGTWSCREGGGFRLSMSLRRSGDLLTGTFDGSDITNVAFADDKLGFDVNIDGQKYHLSFALAGDKLTGRYQGETDAGTLDCGATTTAARTPSPDLVPLYAYHRADGSVDYSTDATLKGPGLKRSEGPVGRVWRNPMRGPVLDPITAAGRGAIPPLIP